MNRPRLLSTRSHGPGTVRSASHAESARRATRTSIGCALLAAMGATLACGGDPATPDECADLPQYDLRSTGRDNGAVQDQGIVDNSPLSAEQQRHLQQLAAQGCITLPHKAYSLKSLDLNATPAATDLANETPAATEER